MRHKYNSFDYWQNLINKNKTIRGHMFMDNLPTTKSVYMHTLIFSKGNGLKNIWGYVPDEMAMIGYIQYSFLSEAFYLWINGKDKLVSNIPSEPVEKIIRDGERSNKITKQEANDMRRYLEMIKKIWSLPKNKVTRELKKFARDFNRTWSGDNKEFLFLKIFESPSELADFVIESAYMSRSKEEYEKNNNCGTMEDLRVISETAATDNVTGDAFRKLLLKYFTEVI